MGIHNTYSQAYLHSGNSEVSDSKLGILLLVLVKIMEVVEVEMCLLDTDSFHFALVECWSKYLNITNGDTLFSTLGMYSHWFSHWGRGLPATA
jgi:hypothetical protein